MLRNAVSWLHDSCKGLLFWRGSRSRKPCGVPGKVAASGNERYTSFVRLLRLGPFHPSVPPRGSAMKT